MFLLNQIFSLILLFGFEPRIISLAPSITDFLIKLNLENLIVGKTYLDPDFIKAEVVLPSSMKISKEKILSLKPTHIISAGLIPEEELYYFKKNGIKVLDFKYESIFSLIETYIVLGKEFEIEKKALNELKSFLDTLFLFKNIKNNKKVLFILDLTNGVWCPGEKTFIDDLIEWTGFDNISDFFEGYKIVSIEKILKEEPDIVIFNFKKGYEALKNTPFRNLKSIREKKFYEVPDPNYFSRPSPLLIRALKFLSKIE
ncbi:MAG: ABC transporter substrate-binding protein [candidate division WOR-3 bacterium]